MDVDVVHFFRSDAGIVEGALHDEFGAFRVRQGDVVGVGTESATDDFAKDVGTARLGVLEFLEDEDGATFAHDEAVARSAERSACGLRAFVARGESGHGVETTDTGRDDSGFATTGHDGVSLAQSDVVEGIDHGVVGACARALRGEVRSTESVANGNLSSGDVANEHRNEERRELWSEFRVRGEEFLFVFHGEHATDAARHDDADFVLVFLLEVEASTFYGLFRRHECVLAVVIKVSQFLAIEVVSRVEVLDFTSELGFEVGGVEVRDGCSTADTGSHGLPSLLDTRGKWVDGTHASNDDAFQFHESINFIF